MMICRQAWPFQLLNEPNFISTWSKHLQSSVAWIYLATFGKKWQEMFSLASSSLRRIFKIFGKCSKMFGKSLKSLCSTWYLTRSLRCTRIHALSCNILYLCTCNVECKVQFDQKTTLNAPSGTWTWNAKRQRATSGFIASADVLTNNFLQCCVSHRCHWTKF